MSYSINKYGKSNFVYSNNTIITNGLVLNLDAGNPQSYSGDEIFWYDLSGNENNGTLFNEIVYNPDNLGSLVFDGIDDYISIQYSTTIDPTDGITIDLWCYPTDITTERYYELYRKETSPGRQLFSFQEFGTVISFGSDTNINDYHELDINITPSNYTNKWIHLVATYTDGYKAIYANGNLIGSSTSVYGTLVQSVGISFIGTLGVDMGIREYFKGSFAAFKIYNRGLASIEVLQNYNALKNRFI